MSTGVVPLNTLLRPPPLFDFPIGMSPPSRKFFKYGHDIHARAASSYVKSFRKTSSLPSSASSW
eukprot:2866098-Lingulodinium_polyedra.AAC.1